MKTILRLLLGAAMALSVAACHTPASNPSASGAPMQLKLYPVPPQHSALLAVALNRVLSGQGDGDKAAHGSARVALAYPGTLMVYAPRNAQHSIAEVIAELARKSGKANAAAAPSRLQVHFWVINAVPGQGKDSPALKPLEKTLDQLRASLGPSHFVLDNAVTGATTTSFAGPSILTTTDQHGYAHIFHFQAERDTGGNIRLKVKYQDNSGETLSALQTTTTLRPGEYVVLAQAPSAHKNHADSLMHLLVVSIDRPGASS